MSSQNATAIMLDADWLKSVHTISMERSDWSTFQTGCPCIKLLSAAATKWHPQVLAIQEKTSRLSNKVWFENLKFT